MLQRHFYKTQESKYKKINEMAQHLNTRQVYHTIFQSVTSDTFYYYVVLSMQLCPYTYGDRLFLVWKEIR